MTRVLSDITATRMVDGYSEEHARTSGSLTEQYSVPWDTRISDVSVLLGSAYSDTTKYPNWKCSKVSIKNGGWEEDATAPTRAILSATYEDPATERAREGGQPNPTTGKTAFSDFVENWSTGGEALTVGKGLKWSDGSGPLDVEDISAVKVFPHTNITLSGIVPTSYIIANGKAAITGNLGKVNDSSYTLKGYSYAAETLMFEGADLAETWDSLTRSSSYHVTLKFAAKTGHTWNQFWNGSTFKEAVTKTGEKLYPTTTMSDVNPDKW